MERRKFLLLTAAGTLAGTLSLPACRFSIPDYDESLANPYSLSHIWDSDTIRAIGNSYMRLTPAEKTESALVTQLLNGRPNDEKGIEERIRQQILQDFTDGNTVLVDGWLLSVTEARQCALLSTIDHQ